MLPKIYCMSTNVQCCLSFISASSYWEFKAGGGGGGFGSDLIYTLGLRYGNPRFRGTFLC
jgi:hypothetical protein